MNIMKTYKFDNSFSFFLLEEEYISPMRGDSFIDFPPYFHTPLVEEILLLREQQEQTNMDEAAKAEHRDRIQALCNFINSQPRTITEFDEALVRKLLESVKVCDVFIEFRFKSGTSVIIEK